MVSGGILVTGVMLALLCLTLWRERADSLAHASQQAGNLALIAQRDIERNFELYELSLRAIAESWGQPEIMAMPVAIRNQVLFDRSLEARNIASGAVVDASGKIVANLKNARILGQDVSDREYFKTHLASRDDRMHISRPFASRVFGGLTNIALSKRISNPDGSFAGVAVLYLNVDYFKELLQGLEIGANGRTTVFGPGGTVFMSLPYAPERIGTDQSATPMYRSIQAIGNGSLVSDSTSDGRSRLMVFRSLSNIDIKILVAPAVDDIYAPWRRRSTPILLWMAAFGIGVIVMSGLLGRELRRRTRMEAHLAVLAHTDGPTGLANRRALEKKLELEALRSGRDGGELCVLFADVDYFKKYNDSQGHPAGDQALAEVATAMSKVAHGVDGYVGRYGGEEFMVVLVQSSEDMAFELAQAIRLSVEKLGIHHPDSPYGVVTVSIGVAFMAQVETRTTTALVKAADAALYDAKQAGRNNVRVAARASIEAVAH